MPKPLVAILMGSDSDLAVMQEAAGVLKEYGVAHELHVLSAHRSPEEARTFARSAVQRGLKVIIAGAGGAAHLAGVAASHTSLPVIGVPIPSGDMKGLDALLSTVQMPSGIPVATVAVGKTGAKNAAYLAVEILALSNAKLAERLKQHKRDLAASVIQKDQKLQKFLNRQED